MNNESSKVGRSSEPGEYDADMLALLQMIWGDGFLSPGGSEEIDRVLEGCDIRGAKVLDIGCGLGAVDQLLIQRHGALSVVGIDIDPGLLALMQARIEASGLGGQIRSLKVEPGNLPFGGASFDVVFSKDSMVQIPNKDSIFAEVLRVLRPGGRLIASDWLRGGTGDYSSEMLEYFRLEGIAYNMATADESVAAMRNAGFVGIDIRDRHEWYLGLAQRELQAMQGSLRPLIVDRIGADRTRHFVDNWRQLVVVLQRGELRPCHLKAAKPARQLS